MHIRVSVFLQECTGIEFLLIRSTHKPNNKWLINQTSWSDEVGGGVTSKNRNESKNVTHIRILFTACNLVWKKPSSESLT